MRNILMAAAILAATASQAAGQQSSRGGDVAPYAEGGAPAAPAIAFGALTTIYVGSGIEDDGGGADAGVATVFHCSNVSGVPVTIRFQVVDFDGTVDGNATGTIPHGGTFTASTHATVRYWEDVNILTGVLDQGVVNIESTNSAVFCNAVTLDASTASPNGFSLPLVRVNPHPGTQE